MTLRMFSETFMKYTRPDLEMGDLRHHSARGCKDHRPLMRRPMGFSIETLNNRVSIEGAPGDPGQGAPATTAVASAGVNLFDHVMALQQQRAKEKEAQQQRQQGGEKGALQQLQQQQKAEKDQKRRQQLLLLLLKQQQQKQHEEEEQQQKQEQKLQAKRAKEAQEAQEAERVKKARMEKEAESEAAAAAACTKEAAEAAAAAPGAKTARRRLGWLQAVCGACAVGLLLLGVRAPGVPEGSAVPGACWAAPVPRRAPCSPAPTGASRFNPPSPAVGIWNSGSKRPLVGSKGQTGPIRILRT